MGQDRQIRNLTATQIGTWYILRHIGVRMLKDDRRNPNHAVNSRKSTRWSAGAKSGRLNHRWALPGLTFAPAIRRAEPKASTSTDLVKTLTPARRHGKRFRA